MSKNTYRVAGGFIEKTIVGIVSLIMNSVLNDEIAARKGFLQSSDPRCKCISVVLLLISVLLTRNRLELGLIYLVIIALVLGSSISAGYFLKRTLFFIPIFSFFIVVPAIFNVVTPGEPVFAFKLFTYNFSITKQGIDSSILFLLRVLVSVSLSILLIVTTRHNMLLKVMRIFKVPQLFVMTMGMCYRYVFLFLDVIKNMFTAIKSRVGYISSTTTGREVVTANMAGLWIHSYRLQTQVYNAMISRGYAGEPKVMDEFHSRFSDYLIVTISTLILIGTICLFY
jgi:cobalt ECF transporter T component CbiQ